MLYNEGADFSRKFQDGESDRALAKFSIRTNYRQVKTPDENTENIITTNSIRLVPPVVDPVHYGIQSAEPLWPIRGHQLPPFMLPSEAVESAAAADQHRREWTRLRPAFRSDEKDGPPILLRQEVNRIRLNLGKQNVLIVMSLCRFKQNRFNRRETMRSSIGSHKTRGGLRLSDHKRRQPTQGIQSSRPSGRGSLIGPPAGLLPPFAHR